MAKWFSACFPMANRHRPFLGRFVNRHVHDLQGRLLVGVDLPVPRELADHAVDRFDRVSGVDRLGGSRGGKSKSVMMSVHFARHIFADCRILRIPGLSEILQRLLGLQRRSPPDKSSSGRAITALLSCVAHVTQRRTDQMHHAQLYAGPGISRVDRLRETRTSRRYKPRRCRAARGSSNRLGTDSQNLAPSLSAQP